MPLGDAGGTHARTCGLKSVEGDCVLNVRKAKLVASYELAIVINFEGSSGEGCASGTIQVPYLAEENADEVRGTAPCRL